MRATEPSGGLTVKVGVWIAARQLGPDRREVVALWGRLNGWRRLVYGELRNGRFTMAWESPVLTGISPSIRRPDVNADGQPEIATESVFGFRPTATMLSVFTVDGDELTRQEECMTDLMELQGFAVACPVIDEVVRFEEGGNGRLDILVDGDEGPSRYVLVGNRYRRIQK